MNIHLKAAPVSGRRLVVNAREHPSEDLELELW